MGKFGAKTKLTNTITIEPDDDDLKESSSGFKMNQISFDLSKLANNCLPSELKDTTNDQLDSIVKITSDFYIKLEDIYVFNVHKAFLAERCDYFKAFLNDPFNEIKVSSVVAEIELKEMPKEVLTEIVFFLYSNNLSTNNLDESLLNDLLMVADYYLLPSLKRKCATELITNHLNRENLFDLLKKSRLFSLKKLEFACISYLADNLFELEKSEQLREIIVSDAAELKQRQETDTIDIVDDLRYAINEKASNYTNKYNTAEFILERERKLYLIDQILAELNLEC